MIGKYDLFFMRYVRLCRNFGSWDVLGSLVVAIEPKSRMMMLSLW